MVGVNNISCIDLKKCYSCRSCEQICPKSCITLHEDKEGFLFPSVNNNCINCGICISHCPSLTPVKNYWITPERYALILKNKTLLEKSSSGGLFGGIANFILSIGGIVYGAAYDEELKVSIIGINSVDELYKIQGSKYVASDTNRVYEEIQQNLKNAKTVLFGGTPCQIAGLKAFLAKSYENLYTMDLICHGVPSAKLFSKYLFWLGKKYKSKILYYGFRDKNISGWACGGKTLVITKKNKKIFEGKCDPYYSAFLRCETYRESCYTCPFAKKIDRIGDISMGDFWATDKEYLNIPKVDGISFCSINTKQGIKLFSLVKNLFYVFECPSDESLKRNIAYNKPSKRPELRNNIYANIDNDDNLFFKKIVCTPYYKILVTKLIRLIPVPIRKSIKKILGK